jgi:UDP:flavonoid glycosyltransferase YjiC (YdhE family)
MSRLKVDVIAPPFHGHLHPILGLAEVLREFADIRVLTTEDAVPAVEAGGFECAPILRGRSAEVWRIANTPRPVRGRPWMLLRQFRENLALLPVLNREVEAAWNVRRPDLALVDFTLPTVGHRARARGVRWWTSHPSPLAIETPDGTPPYLGGWAYPTTAAGRWRDALGRGCVRAFKRTLFSVFRRELRAAGFEHLYREDGYEAVYSDEIILAVGVRELELPCAWPKAVRFVGPVCRTLAESAAEEPALDGRRKNILVTIGTHLLHARERMLRDLRRLAEAMPEMFFHYTTGGGERAQGRVGANCRVYRYLDYERFLTRFDGLVHHGGAGITYHALKAAIPAVVWPQDYDQFDFAARLSHHGLAVRCARAAQIPAALRAVLADDAMRRRREAFAARLRAISLRDNLCAILAEQGLVERR